MVVATNVNGREPESRHLVEETDYEDDIEPWHLYEDAGAEARSQPLHFSRNTDDVQREWAKRSYDHKEADAPFLYHLLDNTVHQQRKRQTPRSDGTSYWYEGVFHYTQPGKPETSFGPDRPITTTSASPSVPSKAVTVAVYYYPWYHTKFHGRNYIRGDLKPPQMPVLGEYDDRSTKVIAQHLEWTRQANVDLWVTSWWGPDSETDITTKNYILKHRELKDMKLCLFYETTGRIDVDTRNTTKVYNDIAYAAKTYFNHPNYHRIDGRPVLFVYLTRVLERQDMLREVLSLMRTAAFDNGHLLYIVGDHAFGSPPDTKLKALNWLDAVTNYDIFGSMNRPDGFAGMRAVKKFSREQAGWKRAANAQGCAYIPGATPGYNDKAVRQGDYNAMSRKLSKRKKEGSLFRLLLRRGRQLVDAKAANLLIVNSFNEWHEDTQIEPVVQGGATALPWYLTRGTVYQGYGELYLNILRKATRDRVSVQPSREKRLHEQEE